MIPKLNRVAEARPVSHETVVNENGKEHGAAFAETLADAEKPTPKKDDEDGRRVRQAPAVHGTVQETRPADRTSAGRRPADRLLLLGRGEVAPRMAKAPLSRR